MPRKIETTDPRSGSYRPGIEAIDSCHVQTLRALATLEALALRLACDGADETSRHWAEDVVLHFSTAARLHHEDEERDVFPALLGGGDFELARVVRRLRQDHLWIARDWLELAPHLDAVASGQSWYDTDVIREGAAVFDALMHEHLALEESILHPRDWSEGRPGSGEAPRGAAD